MIPDFEKRLNEQMDGASLKELMPDFDNEQEWQRLSQKLLPAKKKLLIPVWSYAAAILVLCAAGSITWYLATSPTHEVATKNNFPAGHEVTAPPAVRDTEGLAKVFATDTPPEPKPAVAVVKKHVIAHKGNNKYTANDIIYNGTPCPIELRISQMISCPNNQSKAISSSSTLEPDQKGQLNYKEHNTIGKNCSLTIKEIEIRSTATGEVILLNSKSLPSTAQDVFSYITGEKKGDVIAGVLNYDCDKKTRKHNLRLNNRDGNLTIE